MRTLDDNIIDIEQDKYAGIDIEELLKENKKIVAFLGASKNGTSFIVNNVAKLLSSKGINTAILDATQSNSSYYIYTRNDANLRQIAYSSTEKLVDGIAEGIEVNENLTVYTSVPGENKYLKEAKPILETILKRHTLVLIDCDFKTPLEYFSYAQEIYLVQSMDVLTIQPLTEVLAEIEKKNILDEGKLRIILNKFVNVEGITEKEIIGGMAFYNEPTLSYMKQLFNKNTVQYMVIPFEKEIYVKYLGELVSCDINLDGYSRTFLNLLEQLADNIYQI